MKKIHIPLILIEMNKFFASHGYSAYLVGGAVRDMILNKNATDYDVATNASPNQVMSLFHHVIPTGIAHGTVTVLFKNEKIEVTTFRTETSYTDGRHPDTVNYAATIEEDLSRRDFTMNAIAANLSTGEIIDPFYGINDIKAKVIRSVGTATERFSEDGLRPIRALRFASQLGFEIEKETFEAIPRSIEKTKCISIERFRDEFIKIMLSPKPSLGLKLMEQTGILQFFIPELVSCRDVVQADIRGFHQFDVLDHLFYAADGANKNNLNVRLSALFHDIGKPVAKKTEVVTDTNGEVHEIHTFFRHEIISAKITAKILTRLRFPSKTIDYVCLLINQHMFHYESTWTDAAVRRFMARTTPEAINDLFDLRLADVYGMTCKPVKISNCGLPTGPLIELLDRIEKLEQKQTALSLKDLAINGSDLIKLGIPAGRNIGIILNQLLETVLDDPEQNNREQLITIASNIWAKHKLQN